MKNTLYEEITHDLPEEKRLPRSLDGDLRRASELLAHAKSAEDINVIMERYGRLRDRIKAACGIPAAQRFDWYAEECAREMR